MKNASWSLSAFLQTFFTDHLIRHRHVSENTVMAYRDAWRLFLQFLQSRRGKRPSILTVEELTVADVLAFLDESEAERGNTASTRNARLAALRSAVKYALERNPTLPMAVHGILAIPVKRTPRKMLGFMTRPEVDAVLAAPAVSRWSGRRDRALFETLYNTGARVSEIVGAKAGDFQSDARHLRLHGKGRKERVVPLWRPTATKLRIWIRENGLATEHPLFPNARGTAMTRSGVEKRLAVAVLAATRKCASLKDRKIGPHTFRHTTAMHLLEAGVDLSVIALWLGHESIETTNVYITSDMAMKEKALGALQAPENGVRRFRPRDSLLAFLEGL